MPRKKIKKDTGFKVINTQITNDTHHKMRIIAAVQGMSLEAVYMQAIALYASEHMPVFQK